METFLSEEERAEVDHVIDTNARKGQAMFARSVIPGGSGANPFAGRGGGSVSPRSKPPASAPGGAGGAKSPRRAMPQGVLAGIAQRGGRPGGRR